MKNIVIIRHGRKDGDMVAADQLREIEEKGITGLNEIVKNYQGPVIIHRGTGFDRTRQTIEAFERFLKASKSKYIFGGYLPANPSLGNQEMFNEFTANTAVANEAEKTNWFKAFCDYNPRFIIKIKRILIKEITNIFNQVPESSLTITINHTPLIEWLAFGLDVYREVPRDLKLKELTGFVLTQKDGQITIKETIGF